MRGKTCTNKCFVCYASMLSDDLLCLASPLIVIRYFSVLTFTKGRVQRGDYKRLHFLWSSKVPPLLNRVTNLQLLRVMVCLDKHVHEHRTPVINGWSRFGAGKGDMRCTHFGKSQFMHAKVAHDSYGLWIRYHSESVWLAAGNNVQAFKDWIWLDL